MPRAYNTSFRYAKQSRTYDVLGILSGLPDIKLKIVIQVPYMYPLFRVLSTTTTASENWPLSTKRKSLIKLEKVFITSKCISNSFLPA